jgi:hypothetical protein
VKLLAADFSDDATIQAGLAGLRSELEHARKNLQEMERRAPSVPHRARCLRGINATAGARCTPSSSGSTPCDESLIGPRVDRPMSATAGRAQLTVLVI